MWKSSSTAELAGADSNFLFQAFIFNVFTHSTKSGKDFLVKIIPKDTTTLKQVCKIHVLCKVPVTSSIRVGSVEWEMMLTEEGFGRSIIVACFAEYMGLLS